MALCGILRQSTAIDVLIGPFVDSTDGASPETGLTIDVEVSKNGEALAEKSDVTAPSHDGGQEVDGYYNCELDTTDTNTVGVLTLACFATGALSVRHDYLIVEEAIYDALFAASANAFSGAAGSTTLTALAAGSITATVVATGAIDADAIADNAIDAGAIASNAITSTKVADGFITAAKFGAGAIDATAIANGAIDAATFAAGAIDAAALAADAGTEIGTAVWATTTRALTILDEDSTTLDLNATILAAVGLASANLDTQLADIETKVDDLETRLGTPSDLGGGATVAANLADIEAQTDDIGSAGAGLTALATQASVNTIDGIVDAIVADTNELQTDWANGGRLDLILDARASQTSVDDLPTNAELATALAAADDAVLAAIAALENLSAAEVNAEVVDALATDTYAEPGQGSPAATAALSAKIGYLYKAWRNRTTQTATEYALYADDAATKDQEAAVSDDGVTFTRGEVATGA